MKKLLIYAMLSFTAGLLFSCGRELDPTSQEKGTGDLVIHIGTSGRSSTKAGTAADGDVMNNLHIWIVNPSGEVVRYACWPGTDGDIVMESGSATASARFANIERNTYTVYLVANKPSGLVAPVVGDTVGDDFKEYVLAGFTGNKPDFGEDGMPLSLVESVSISAGSNSLQAELLRTCGRIRVTIRNNTTDKNLFLQSLVLDKRNPDRGYLFQKNDHSVPGDISYSSFNGSFSKENLYETVTEYIAPKGETTIIDQYIYESGVDAVADMGLSFTGGVFDKEKTSATLETGTAYDYTAGEEFKTFYDSKISKDGLYIIRNSGKNYFLKSDGTILREKFHMSIDDFLASENVKEYLWKFDYTDILSGGTGPSHSPIQNYATGQYINFTNSGSTEGGDISLSSTSQIFIIGTQPMGMLIRYDNSNDKVYCQGLDNSQVYTRYLSEDISNVYWYMSRVTETKRTIYLFTGALKSFDKSLPNINYLDEFGISVPLTHICRNEDVNIVINVYYNPEFATVNFGVEAWTSVSNETTFD
ncbi:MAG: hypothetical protein ACI3ZL_09360 [Candidatus Cryptobacteroides sp.]